MVTLPVVQFRRENFLQSALAEQAVDQVLRADLQRLCQRFFEDFFLSRTVDVAKQLVERE